MRFSDIMTTIIIGIVCMFGASYIYNTYVGNSQIDKQIEQVKQYVDIKMNELEKKFVTIESHSNDSKVCKDIVDKTTLLDQDIKEIRKRIDDLANSVNKCMTNNPDIVKTETLHSGEIDNKLSNANITTNNIKDSINTKLIKFSVGSSELLPSSFNELNKLANMMISNNNIRINIHGFTDNAGSDVANIRLSFARAKSVRDFLIGVGVGGNRISIQGHGSQHPIADNKSDSGRELSRRIEIEIMSN